MAPIGCHVAVRILGPNKKESSKEAPKGPAQSCQFEPAAIHPLPPGAASSSTQPGPVRSTEGNPWDSAPHRTAPPLSFAPPRFSDGLGSPCGRVRGAPASTCQPYAEEEEQQQGLNARATNQRSGQPGCCPRVEVRARREGANPPRSRSRLVSCAPPRSTGESYPILPLVTGLTAHSEDQRIHQRTMDWIGSPSTARGLRWRGPKPLCASYKCSPGDFFHSRPKQIQLNREKTSLQFYIL